MSHTLTPTRFTASFLAGQPGASPLWVPLKTHSTVTVPLLPSLTLRISTTSSGTTSIKPCAAPAMASRPCRRTSGSAIWWRTPFSVYMLATLAPLRELQVPPTSGTPTDPPQSRARCLPRDGVFDTTDLAGHRQTGTLQVFFGVG